MLRFNCSLFDCVPTHLWESGWILAEQLCTAEVVEDEHQQQSCRGREAGSSSGWFSWRTLVQNILPRKNLSHTANISQAVPARSTFASVGQLRMEEDMLAQDLWQFTILYRHVCLIHPIKTCIPSSLWSLKSLTSVGSWRNLTWLGKPLFGLSSILGSWDPLCPFVLRSTRKSSGLKDMVRLNCSANATSACDAGRVEVPHAQWTLHHRSCQGCWHVLQVGPL